MAVVDVTIEEFIDRDGRIGLIDREDRIGQFDLVDNTKVVYELIIQDASKGFALIKESDSLPWAELKDTTFSFNSDDLISDSINVLLKVTVTKSADQTTSRSGDVMNRFEEYITISPSNSYYLDLCENLGLTQQGTINVVSLLDDKLKAGESPTITLNIISLRLAKESVSVEKSVVDLKDEADVIRDKIRVLQLGLESLQASASNYSIKNSEGVAVKEVERTLHDGLKNKSLKTDTLTALITLYTSIDNSGGLSTTDASKYSMARAINVNLTKLRALLDKEHGKGGGGVVPK
jgi:hypothetical protein